MNIQEFTLYMIFAIFLEITISKQNFFLGCISEIPGIHPIYDSNKKDNFGPEMKILNYLGIQPRYSFNSNCWNRPEWIGQFSVVIVELFDFEISMHRIQTNCQCWKISRSVMRWWNINVSNNWILKISMATQINICSWKIESGPKWTAKRSDNGRSCENWRSVQKKTVLC